MEKDVRGRRRGELGVEGGRGEVVVRGRRRGGRRGEVKEVRGRRRGEIGGEGEEER